MERHRGFERCSFEKVRPWQTLYQASGSSIIPFHVWLDVFFCGRPAPVTDHYLDPSAIRGDIRWVFGPGPQGDDDIGLDGLDRWIPSMWN